MNEHTNTRRAIQHSFGAWGMRRSKRRGEGEWDNGGSWEFFFFLPSSHLSPSPHPRVLSLSHLCCIHDATEDNCCFTWRFIESSAEQKDNGWWRRWWRGAFFAIHWYYFLCFSLPVSIPPTLCGVHLRKGSKAWCCINATSHVDSCLAIPETLCVSGSESGCCSAESNARSVCFLKP